MIPSSTVFEMYPLGFTTIASYLHDRGMEVWLPHAHGALEIARIVKQLHPDVPVIFGGLSSSYFHRELIGYSQVDFVLRGDSTRAVLAPARTQLPPDRNPAHPGSIHPRV